MGPARDFIGARRLSYKEKKKKHVREGVQFNPRRETGGRTRITLSLKIRLFARQRPNVLHLWFRWN